jgi:hypothetical protein
VVKWLYESLEAELAGRGGTGRDGGRRRERSEDDGGGPRKRPRSPSPDASGRSTTPEPTTAQETSFHGRGGRVGESSGNSGGNTREGPGRPALEGLLGVINRMCRSGDGCPSLRLRGQKPCSWLHSADIKALEGLPPWARETALTFVRAHPSAELGPGEYDRQKWIKSETAWKEGSKRLVRRWVDNPELAATEAPAVPAPHPDAAPSGAPRGFKRGDLLELKDLTQQLCFRAASQCAFHARRACKALHPEDLTPSRASRWARDELERLVNSHPYQNRRSCEAEERTWKAGLIRQVERWIEWHEAAER